MTAVNVGVNVVDGAPKVVLAASTANGQHYYRIYDVATGVLDVKNPSSGPIDDIIYSGSGAVVTRSGNSVRVDNDGARTIVGCQSVVTSPDGSWLAAATSSTVVAYHLSASSAYYDVSVSTGYVSTSPPQLTFTSANDLVISGSPVELAEPAEVLSMMTFDNGWSLAWSIATDAGRNADGVPSPVINLESFDDDDLVRSHNTHNR